MSLHLSCYWVLDWLTRNPLAWIFITMVLQSFLTAERKVNFALGEVTAASLHVEMWGFYSSPYNHFTKEQARGRWWPMGRERRAHAILICPERSEEWKLWMNAALIDFENGIDSGQDTSDWNSLLRSNFFCLFGFFVFVFETQLQHIFMLLGCVILGNIPAAFDICMIEQLKSAVVFHRCHQQQEPFTIYLLTGRWSQVWLSL